MKTVTIAELERLDIEKITVIDIRKPEDYKRGTYKNAINITVDKLVQTPQGRPVYVLCYTGDNSIFAAETLEEMGYEAYNIDGGWRAYLRLYLERVIKNNETANKTAEIERSIIKKFRKNIWCRFTKAIQVKATFTKE